MESILASRTISISPAIFSSGSMRQGHGLFRDETEIHLKWRQFKVASTLNGPPHKNAAFTSQINSQSQSRTPAQATLESLLDANSSIAESKEALKEKNIQRIEDRIERMIFDCRFLTLLAVIGSLCGSCLCFFKGTLFVAQSFREFVRCMFVGHGTGEVILLLVEAVDVYLVGTVMLIFGMGLYELFVSALEVPADCNNCISGHRAICGSNFFGLFRLKERPGWLEIHSLDELKTKLGHVIVMILLVGMFEKSKKVVVKTGMDLLCFSASIFLASACLFLLSKLHQRENEDPKPFTA